LALLILLVWFIRRRRNKKRQEEEKKKTDLDPTPWNPSAAHTPGGVVTPFQHSGNSYSQHPYAQNNQHRGSTTSIGYPHSVEPTNTSSKYSQSRPSHTGYGTSTGGAPTVPSSGWTSNALYDSRPTSTSNPQLEYYQQAQPWAVRTSIDNQFQPQPQPQPQPQRPQHVPIDSKAQYRGSQNELQTAGMPSSSSNPVRQDSAQSPKDNPPPYAI
jgi:hypothetical protein